MQPSTLFTVRLRAVVLASLIVPSVAGCLLLTSTDDFTGGSAAPDAAPDAAPGTDGSGGGDTGAIPADAAPPQSDGASKPDAGVELDWVSVGHASSLTTTLKYSHTVGSGTDRLLIVGVMLPAETDVLPPVPAVNTLTYDNVPMTRLGAKSRSDNEQRYEEWYLVDPHSGIHDVDIVTTTTGPARRLLSAAVSFFGVDQQAPLRGFMVTDGNDGTRAAVTTTSIAGDVVVDIVCAGNSLVGPIMGQTERAKSNFSSRNACDNIGASTRPGASPSVEMAWTIVADNWGIMAVSIKPAAPR